MGLFSLLYQGTLRGSRSAWKWIRHGLKVCGERVTVYFYVEVFSFTNFSAWTPNACWMRADKTGMCRNWCSPIWSCKNSVSGTYFIHYVQLFDAGNPAGFRRSQIWLWLCLVLQHSPHHSTFCTFAGWILEGGRSGTSHPMPLAVSDKATLICTPCNLWAELFGIWKWVIVTVLRFQFKIYAL